MKKILVLISLFFVSCTSLDDVRMLKKHRNIDKEFHKYVSSFMESSLGAVSSRRIKGLTMGFTNDKDSSIAGTCWPHIKEIDIDLEWWNNNPSPLQRQSLIFHELGHCLLYRSHTNATFASGILGEVERLLFKAGFFKPKDTLSDGCPPSLMSPFLVDNYCIMRHHAYYLNELFTEQSYDEFVRHYETEYACEAPLIYNYTVEWNNIDQWTLSRAESNCIKIYRACLKKLIKKKHNTYQAICG